MKAPQESAPQNGAPRVPADGDRSRPPRGGRLQIAVWLIAGLLLLVLAAVVLLSIDVYRPLAR